MKLKVFKERDKKKIGIIIFTIGCILLIGGVFLYSSFALFETNENFNILEGNAGNIGDITFTYYIDGIISKSAPEKESEKKFDEKASKCNNEAMVRWNYEDWGPVVTGWNKERTKCQIYFNSEYKENLLNGAFPVLKEELTPITIKNDGLVKKADTTSKWYSYEEKNWANAVITRSSYDGLNKNGKVNGATKQDGYVSFDGVDDTIDLGLENYDFINGLSISLSFSLDELPTTHNPSLIGSWSGAGGGGISVTKEGNIQTMWKIAGLEYTTLVAEEKINLNEFYTVTITFDNQTLKLFVNGKLVKQVTKEGKITATPSQILIGANPNATSNVDHMKGKVKQLALFDRALTEEEVKEDYKDTIHVKNEERLLRYVDFTNREFEANEVIPEESIESYFVWIPRYRYKIFDNGIYMTTVENYNSQAKEIKIQFESKDAIPSNGTNIGEWLTHPAFTSFQSNGMWVGKFETSNKNTAIDNSVNPGGIEIKPNEVCWRGIDVSNAFYSTYDYKRNLDSHMMKNTEWGSVAYLSHSKYGINDNIRMNNHSGYVTGYAAKVEPTCGYTNSSTDCNAYCNDGSCNEPYNTTIGYLASTTGNISGIYDMAGGAWEYVMGVVTNLEGNPFSGRTPNYNSGFNGPLSNGDNVTSGKDWPEEKYYDKYAYGENDRGWIRRILGDATGEMGPFTDVTYIDTRSVGSWYADHGNTVHEHYAWYERGGSHYYGSTAGIFAFGPGYGSAYDFRTFRVVLTP